MSYFPSNAEVIAAQLEREGATIAKLVALRRGGTRSAYESARRALTRMSERGELWAGRFSLTDEDGFVSVTPTVFARSKEDAEAFVRQIGFFEMLTSDVPTNTYVRRQERNTWTRDE